MSRDLAPKKEAAEGASALCAGGRERQRFVLHDVVHALRCWAEPVCAGVGARGSWESMNDPMARVLAVLGMAMALCAGCELAESEEESLASSEMGDVAAGLTAEGAAAGSVAAGSVAAVSIAEARVAEAAVSAAVAAVAETGGAESRGPLAGEVDLGGVLELDPDPTPDPPSDCVCISFPDPGSCAEEQFFCNAGGSCVCDTGGRLGTILAPNTIANVLSSGRSAPDSSSDPAPGAERAARATIADPTPPVLEIGCICGPGSVSAPASDCHPASWYCNASAVCRCRR